MSKYDYDVVIIGSGVGGLTSATLLAKSGLKVLVLERLDRVGGCCSNYDEEGFQPEVGAIFVIGPEFYYKYFELLDLRLEDYLDWKLIDPVYHVLLDDGTSVVLPQGIDETAEVIRHLSPEDVPNFYRFCSDLKKVMGAYEALLSNPMPELVKATRPAQAVRLLANKEILQSVPPTLKLASRNIDQLMRKYFKDDRIRMMFGWENFYAALPARRANGMLSVITYMGRMGFYYPRGGMIAIPKALQRILEHFGGEIRFNTRVERIVVKAGEAKGVLLEDGTMITAKAVVSNVHSRLTYGEMMGAEHLPRRFLRTVYRQPCSIPAPTFYLGLKEKLEDVKAHFTVLLPERRKFDDLFHDFYEQGLLYRPDDGPMLVSCPTVDDPGLAPDGGQVFSVIYIAPYRLKYHHWDDIADTWAHELTDSLDRRAFPGLASKVTWMDSVTPLELERRLNLPEGAFFGLEMSGPNLGPFRPSYRSRAVGRLYLCGQCTNPGGGVPLVMASGIAAWAALTRDWTRWLA